MHLIERQVQTSKGRNLRMSSTKSTAISFQLTKPRIHGKSQIEDGRVVDKAYILDYLRCFGYLRNNDSPTEDDVTKAVREFQESIQVEATGEVNDVTTKMMMKPRCSAMQNLVDGSSGRMENFTLNGSKFTKNNITYKINSYTNDMGGATVDVQIGKAFKVWSDVTPLTFTSTAGNADIDISFVTGSHGDGEAFDGMGNVLAHASRPRNNSSDLHFDDSEQWDLRNNGTNLLQVAAHEIGHSLGLSHSNVNSALMAPFYRYEVNFALDPDDIAAIQRLYGAPDKPVNPGPTSPKGWCPCILL